jgi:GDPmannose 4,6-dehydratase
VVKTALITGITGQDGSYLAELLLEKGYAVHGVTRRVASERQEDRLSRIKHLEGKVQLHYGDITDFPRMYQLVLRTKPDEAYHLAAQSQVKVSFEDEIGTFITNVNGTQHMLSAIKDIKPDCKFYFAATSELYGDVRQTPQSEETPFNPVSPYAVSKLAGFHLTKMYRDGYKIFACSGILFNHESPRRGEEFVTRKITSAAARIKLGLEHELRLGNLDAKRDWGHAKDYVEAMWLMLQQAKPHDYVIGTGENHSIRDFLDIAFGMLDLDWKKHVAVDERFYRPLEVSQLLSDPSKARKKLGWKPRVPFEQLVKMMVEADLERLKRQA